MRIQNWFFAGFRLPIPFGLGLCLLIALLSSCTNDDEAQPEVEPPYKNYLRVSDQFYELKEVTAVYDQKGAETTFSIYLTNSEEDNSVLIDFFILPNTTILTEGKFNLKPITHLSQMAVNNFYIVDLEWGTANSKTQVSSLQTPFTNSSLTIKKVGDNYILDADFEYNSQKATVHFEGPVEYIQAW